MPISDTVTCQTSCQSSEGCENVILTCVEASTCVITSVTDGALDGAIHRCEASDPPSDTQNGCNADCQTTDACAVKFSSSSLLLLSDPYVYYLGLHLSMRLTLRRCEYHMFMRDIKLSHMEWKWYYICYLSTYPSSYSLHDDAIEIPYERTIFFS